MQFKWIVLQQKNVCFKWNHMVQMGKHEFMGDVKIIENDDKAQININVCIKIKERIKNSQICIFFSFYQQSMQINYARSDLLIDLFTIEGIGFFH